MCYTKYRNKDNTEVIQMTREKKEIIKKLDAAYSFLNAEDEMGCGFTPQSWIDEFHEKEIDPLEQRLAELRGFSCPMAMWLAEEKILIEKGLFKKLGWED